MPPTGSLFAVGVAPPLPTICHSNKTAVKYSTQLSTPNCANIPDNHNYPNNRRTPPRIRSSSPPPASPSSNWPPGRVIKWELSNISWGNAKSPSSGTSSSQDRKIISWSTNSMNITWKDDSIWSDQIMRRYYKAQTIHGKLKLCRQSRTKLIKFAIKC